MELLNPDSNQGKPTFAQARTMCQQVPLEIKPLIDPRLDSVLNRIGETHANGGALFASFNVGPSKAFDWFASRDRLLEFGILRQILDRVEVSIALPALKIQPSTPEDPAFVVRRLGDHAPETYEFGDDYEFGDCDYDGNFRARSSFLFDGQLAQVLYAGGAYTRATGDGRVEKENSLAFCEALFGLRFSEVSHFSSRSAWTPWFGGIAWDWTAILFDRRARTLSILAVTDTD
ncbi:MAG TPA: hypothetical protein VG267_16620 [Terracidiphilus sp.]|jgi:hypothetical protein|nr:hypothetical protein [Terracidiphilus sp.]